MIEYIIGFIKDFFFLVGLGVLLYYYAYAIAWGFKKGWSKLPNITTVNITKDVVKDLLK